MERRTAVFFALALLALGALTACGGKSPTAVPTPTPVPSLPPPKPTPAPTPTPPPKPNHAPMGEFRFTPTPDPDGVLRIGLGDTQKVNAAHFVDPDGDPLYLTVVWGDGAHAHVGCGPCRLQHVYARLGKWTLVASITDLKATVEAKHTVIVR